MTQSSFTRLLVRMQIGSLVAFLLAAAVAVLVMMPYFGSGAVIERDGDYTDKTGGVRKRQNLPCIRLARPSQDAPA